MLERPQVIAANKTDCIFGEEDPVQKLRDRYEPMGIPVFPISAVTGQGVKELLYHVQQMLEEMDQAPVVFEREYFPDSFVDLPEEPYTVEKTEDGVFSVEGPRIERMLGYTNLESEKGFQFFQNFMKENGILEELEALGITDGDTVRIYGHEFDYYK